MARRKTDRNSGPETISAENFAGAEASGDGSDIAGKGTAKFPAAVCQFSLMNWPIEMIFAHQVQKRHSVPIEVQSGDKA